MQFQAKTKQQIDDERLLPKGDYDFEIIDAEEKTSTKGNGMIELTVRVSNGNGLTRTLTDYVMAQRMAKLYNCCAAIGILDKFNGGTVSDDDFPGKRGRLKLAVEKKKGWPDRNVIADYLTNEAA